MTRVGAAAVALVAIAGIAWQYLETTPVRLGFEDTDDPALMVSFIRQYPAVFSQAGVVLVLMAIALIVAVLAVTPVIAPARDSLSSRTTMAFGLIAAAILLVGGGIRVGSSGPLLHMAGLSQASGEAAYVAAQVASQAALITGILALCLWIVGLSVGGVRNRTLPALMCALAIAPAYRIAGGLLGPLGLLPQIDVFWFLGVLSILGTFAWLLLLGIVLFRRAGPTNG
ncbi:MAG: hypothetical protein QFC55_02720 [Chloroflexota bacterium]|nr:hypothetical protein [Chloroflexota bacterium]